MEVRSPDASVNWDLRFADSVPQPLHLGFSF
jgi:hypothetical protein